jgi:succinyl-CoA synthetase alpha subunit
VTPSRRTDASEQSPAGGELACERAPGANPFVSPGNKFVCERQPVKSFFLRARVRWPARYKTHGLDAIVIPTCGPTRREEACVALRSEIVPSFYQDSVVLMRVAGEIRTRPGVREAGAFMGTPANHELLERTGLATAESRGARPDDLILVVDADTEADAREALAAAHALLRARRHAGNDGVAARPRTLDAALRALPGANIAAISVPGAYAAYEAMRALRRGLHVFLFSDNVPVAEEVRLKREAVARGLLCMGPDCGTAYLNGQGLGFANAVPRGRVGCVAAAGTGLQAVVSHLAALGEGISHGIGVGGRDLTAEVGGLMTLFALEALAGDPATEAVVLVSKPPDAAVLGKLEAALDTIGKPVTVCCLGASGRGDRTLWVRTLHDAAGAAAARLQGRPWSPRAFRDPADARERLRRLTSAPFPAGAAILGLYTGGTLAHESHLLLEELLGPAQAVRILDLGDDQYTVGRPHPMIDPHARGELLVEAGGRREVGLLLADVVLGSASHPDPAAPLAAAFTRARAQAEAEGRRLLGLASVVGTSGDRQGLATQVERLAAAGFEVMDSNAEAARMAAMVVRPDLASRLLPGG